MFKSRSSAGKFTCTHSTSQTGLILYSLSGKLAVVTGGTSGIGLAVARNFVENGAQVIITGRRDSGKSIAETIGAVFICCDATDENQVREMFSGIEANHGKINVLIANAGIASDEGSIADFGSSEMKQLMYTNFNGTFYALKYGPQHMSDGGSIICTGSVSGSGTTAAGGGVYAASKAAVAYLTRTCAIELAPRAIRANVVCPALIADTGMMAANDGGPEARIFSQMTALGRMGSLDEVVGAYNFLASDGATFITGQELCVDGGLTAGLGLPTLDAICNST